MTSSAANPKYLEVTDASEIAKAQSLLSKQLAKEFRYVRERVVGWPSGHFHAEVRFAALSGPDASWWYSGVNPDGDAYLNLVGRGDPVARATLLIDLQFNFPSDRPFDRKQGGVFILDVASREVLLGHRGIVTRGKSRVPRDMLLDAADLTRERIVSAVSPGYSDVLLVAGISCAGLGKEVRQFALQLRTAANAVMGNDGRAASAASRRWQRARAVDVQLREYFDEFVGTRVSSRAGQSTVDCHHGTIVKALRRRFRGMGQAYKSKEVDLVVESDDQALLFEVKTRADPQSVYTAIGQLMFHRTGMKWLLHKPVTPCLVLPSSDADERRAAVCRELGISILSFHYKEGLVLFVDP